MKRSIQGLVCLFLFQGFIAAAPQSALAQTPKCSTVKDCAQQMVAIASSLKAENVALTKRVAELEKLVAKIPADMAAAREARVKHLASGGQTIVNNGGNGQSELCPEQYYMVGAKWQVDGGGPHGIMSWFGPICRLLR